MHVHMCIYTYIQTHVAHVHMLRSQTEKNQTIFIQITHAHVHIRTYAYHIHIRILTHTHTNMQAPNWEELENFDSDDLWPERAFILIEKSDEPRTAHVWVGSEFMEEQDSEAEEYARKAVKAFERVCVGVLVVCVCVFVCMYDEGF
jgi:hypothetical protein